MRSGFLTLGPRTHQVAIGGRIVDGPHGQPLAGAVIQAMATGATTGTAGAPAPPATTLSRRDGSYVFLDLPAGNYRLTVEAPGRSFDPSTLTAAVEYDGAPRFVDFQLLPPQSSPPR